MAEMADEIKAMMDRMAERAEKGKAYRLKLFAEMDCPSCVIDSPKMKACDYAEYSDPDQGEPSCKHVAALEKRKADAAKAEERRKKLHAAGIDLPASSPVLLGCLEERKALNAVRSVLNSPDIRWLVLAGPPGTGKTMAALHALATRHGMFVTSGDLSRPRPIDEAKGWTIEGVRKERLLVIDDLGVEPRTDYAAAQVEEVLCGREYTGLTIITTNLPSDKFAITYGARVASRITGKQGIWVSCTGTDARIGDKRIGPSDAK